MIFRRAMILLGAMLLSGCGMWSGPAFYPVDKSFSWLPRGTYRSQSEGKSRYGRWDGKSFIELPSGKRQKQDWFLTMTTLAGTKLDASIAQISPANGKDGAIYALVVRDGNTWTYVLPDCATTRKIVTDAGGIMDGPTGLRKETAAEAVSFSDLTESGPLSTNRATKHRNHPRHSLRAKSAPIVQSDPVKSAEASPAVDDDRYGGQACHFTTRESLEASARRYLAERQLIGDKIIRIGD